MKEIEEKTQARDRLYKNMPALHGASAHHADAKREFDKQAAGMQRDVQRILKRNDDMQCSAQDMLGAFHELDADTT